MKAKMVTGLLLVLLVTGVFGIEFGLDDDPSVPGNRPIVMPPFKSAEDEFGLNLPATIAGLIGPSPSLQAFGLKASDILLPGPGRKFPIDPLFWVDSFSANHRDMTPEAYPRLKLSYSIDRATSGIVGSASKDQADKNQQPGDIYDSTVDFGHPAFPEVPMGAPFVNVLYMDESYIGLTAGNGPGVCVGPDVICPPITPGSHDNLDSLHFEEPLPSRPMNFVYFTMAPADAVIWGCSPSDIFVLPAGDYFFPPNRTPWAVAESMGLIHGEDSIDALVVWDNYPSAYLDEEGLTSQVDPGEDWALFSLSPGSVTLQQGGHTPATIFVTHFNGNFFIYTHPDNLGLLSDLGYNSMNVDALEVFDPEDPHDPPPCE